MEMMLKVDTAVVVPVNLFPLLDDTDFKTRETAVAYNAAGMDLVWNFVTKAGATSQTAVTPTTGGVYDWAHTGDGMYNIEIPASGGASINNDTEGYGWFTGVATGVLPWRSPVFCFVVATTVDALLDASANLTTLLSPGTGTGQISLASGAVTAGTVSDKTGYALATAPPTLAQIEASTLAKETTAADAANAAGTASAALADLIAGDAAFAAAALVNSPGATVDQIAASQWGRIVVKRRDLFPVGGWTGMSVPVVTAGIPADCVVSVCWKGWNPDTAELTWREMMNKPAAGTAIPSTDPVEYADGSTWYVNWAFLGGAQPDAFPVPSYACLQYSVEAGATAVPAHIVRLNPTGLDASDCLHNSVYCPPVAAGAVWHSFVRGDGHAVVPYGAYLAGDWGEVSGVAIPANLAVESAPGAIEAATGAATIDEAALTAAIIAALDAYDRSVSSSHGMAPTGLMRGGSISAVSPAGPRTRTLVSAIFEEVRSNLRSPGATGLYSPTLMVGYYNRILPEIWSLLVQLGAELIHSYGTLETDGAGQDYELPADFQAFKPDGFLPRAPITATADYRHGRPLPQAALLDPTMVGSPTTQGTPTAFAIFVAGDSQYLRFNTIPQAGLFYDFIFYPTVPAVSVDSISSTFTPWLGLCDGVIKRLLEELCREGLEYLTGKRELWTARAQADLAMLQGLRRLEERKAVPSIWRK
jgi:hypothetical protein